MNPFEYRTNLRPEPIFLVHAVMALSGHHVHSTTSLHHRIAALQLLRESLNTDRSFESTWSMLDTVIILFSLDVSVILPRRWKQS